jgi:hypothetical protein
MAESDALESMFFGRNTERMIHEAKLAAKTIHTQMEKQIKPIDDRSPHMAHVSAGNARLVVSQIRDAMTESIDRGTHSARMLLILATLCMQGEHRDRLLQNCPRNKLVGFLRHLPHALVAFVTGHAFPYHSISIRFKVPADFVHHMSHIYTSS